MMSTPNLSNMSFDSPIIVAKSFAGQVKNKDSEPNKSDDSDAEGKENGKEKKMEEDKEDKKAKKKDMFAPEADMFAEEYSVSVSFLFCITSSSRLYSFL